MTNRDMYTVQMPFCGVLERTAKHTVWTIPDGTKANMGTQVLTLRSAGNAGAICLRMQAGMMGGASWPHVNAEAWDLTIEGTLKNGVLTVADGRQIIGLRQIGGRKNTDARAQARGVKWTPGKYGRSKLSTKEARAMLDAQIKLMPISGPKR
jgi:hypothetical protein